MDNYELEIQKILDEIDYTKYKSLSESQKETECAIRLIYEPFLRYPNNSENMELAKEEINDYEYVRNIDDIKVGNKVKYLTKRYFFNMKLSDEMTVTSKSRFYITGHFGLYVNRCKISNTHFFKKINEDKLIKMKLVELINND
tara:strand:+ start:3800 stop:4228 length:429 start_codon:yes stop_codon:yes gene_type:complete